MKVWVYYKNNIMTKSIKMSVDIVNLIENNPITKLWFSNKSHAKTVLIKHFKVNLDYIFLLTKTGEQKLSPITPIKASGEKKC